MFAYVVCVFFFFFSSRRRHTRLQGDWSDVCSPDLTKGDGATGEDVSVLTSWIDSAQGLTLVLLSGLGAWFIARKSDWDGAQRSEFYLAGWLALGLGAELATAHPTFERYFLLVIPFAAILAMAGLYVAATRCGLGDRPFAPDRKSVV